MTTQNTQGNAREMDWTEERERAFLEILLERVKQDVNGTPSFKPSDWVQMDNELYLRIGVRYGKVKVKAKYHRLRLLHSKFTELINHTGTTYDKETGMVSADDSVWADYCQV